MKKKHAQAVYALLLVLWVGFGLVFWVKLGVYVGLSWFLSPLLFPQLNAVTFAVGGGAPELQINSVLEENDKNL